MNFQGISVTQLTAWAIIGLGLVFAAWLGVLVAEGNQTLLLALFGLIAGVVIFIGMGQSIWLLIPLCWPLTGSIHLLPLPFSVQEVAVMGAFLFFCTQVAMKQFRGVKPRLDYLDLFIGINLAIVLVMYLRNPIGFAALGSEIVGGRPYLKIAIGAMAFVVLSRIVIRPKLAYYFPIILLGPSALVGLISTATYVFPQLAPIVAPIYSGIDARTYVTQEFGVGVEGPVTLQEGRFNGLASIGLPLIAALFAYNSPSRVLSVFARPALFGLLCLAMLMVGMSGFRSYLFEAGAVVLLAAYLWEKGLGLFRITALAVVAVALVMVAQSIAPLPNSVQRAFSFLPGPWNERIKQHADESTDWRVEMWQIALSTDRYIKNKWIGDGFGFTAQELELIRSASLGGTGFIGGEAHKEAFMVQGSFHSGPLSSIRFAGYTGLLAIIVLQVSVAAYAVKMLRLAWSTDYRPLAIILALAAIYKPLAFIFIFGEYRNDLPNALFAAGMLKMLHNSLLAQRATAKPKDAADTVEQSTPLPPIHRPAVVGAHYARH